MIVYKEIIKRIVVNSPPHLKLFGKYRNLILSKCIGKVSPTARHGKVGTHTEEESEYHVVHKDGADE